MIKRDKSNFYRENESMQDKLEREFDHIVTSINQIESGLNENLKIVRDNVNELVKAQESTGGVVTTSGGSTGGGKGGKFASARISALPFTEKMIYGSNLEIIKKPYTASDTTLDLTNIIGTDELESIMVKVDTPDTGVNDFKINDGTNDLVNIEDIDFTRTSVQIPAKSCWVTYTSSAILRLYQSGGTTLTGLIILKILRSPQVMK